MKKLSFALVLSGAAILSLAACESGPTAKHSELDHAHFWQRAEASSAIYQRGPKAQQMLHRDIAECTYQVRELVRLGSIRAATPADADRNGNIPDPATPEGRLAQWETPERDGYLLTEHTDYHDFEACMQTMGWERVEYLPYDVATEGRETYIETILGEERRTESGEREGNSSPPKGDFDSLNN